MSLFLRTLAEFHRRTLGWAAVAAVSALGYIRIYDDLMSDFERVIRMPDMRYLFDSVERAPLAGYVETTVYGLLPSMLVVLCAISLGAQAVAGLEERGELELLLAGPIGRRRLVLTRYAGFATSIVLAGLVIWAAAQWFVFVGRIPVEPVGLAAACAGLVLVSLLFGSMSFAAGAFTGDRGIALMLAGPPAVVAFSLRALADTVDEARAMRWLSPFHYHLSDPISRPFWPAGYELLMILLIAGLLALAVYGFQQRDVGTEVA